MENFKSSNVKYLSKQEMQDTNGGIIPAMAWVMIGIFSFFAGVIAGSGTGSGDK